MYEFFILSCLVRTPMHGYLIAKVIGDITGPFRRLQWGALYPHLSRMVAEGLIEVVECPEPDDGRPRKIYSVTDDGRRRLHELLMDTERHQAEYDSLFPHKVMLFSQLTSEERMRLSRHYAVYAQQNIDHLERERRDLVTRTPPSLLGRPLEDILTVLDHRIAYWTHERTWAEDLIAQHTTKEAV